MSSLCGSELPGHAPRGVASALAAPDTCQHTPDSGIAVEQRRMFDATGIRSAAVVPMRGTGEVLEGITLGRAVTPGEFSTPDSPLIEDIARRASLALERPPLPAPAGRRRDHAEAPAARGAERPPGRRWPSAACPPPTPSRSAGTDVCMATPVFARVTRTDNGPWRLSWTYAGRTRPCSPPAKA